MKLTFVRNGTVTVSNQDEEAVNENVLVGDEWELPLLADRGRFLDLLDTDGSVVTVNKTDIRVDEL
jgi:hypothetical protein